MPDFALGLERKGDGEKITLYWVLWSADQVIVGGGLADAKTWPSVGAVTAGGAAGARLKVRVSLGLKAQFEKSLFWEPKKRISWGGAGAGWTEDVIVVPRPEGVYVYDGNGVDHVRLFSHDGNYLRTVYPFPASKLKAVKGLEWKDYPHGYARPQKNGLNGGIHAEFEAVICLFTHDSVDPYDAVNQIGCTVDIDVNKYHRAQYQIGAGFELE